MRRIHTFFAIAALLLIHTFFAIAALLLTGCSTQSALIPIPHSKQDIAIPTEGVGVNAQVGDIIYTYTTGTLVPAVALESHGHSSEPVKTLSCSG